MVALLFQVEIRHYTIRAIMKLKSNINGIIPILVIAVEKINSKLFVKNVLIFI